MLPLPQSAKDSFPKDGKFMVIIGNIEGELQWHHYCVVRALLMVISRNNGTYLLFTDEGWEQDP